MSRRKVGIVVIDRADLADHVHAVRADVVEPANEGRHERRAGLGGEQSLIGREAQRHVDHGPVAGQRLAGFEAVHRQRHLDRDVLGDLGAARRPSRHHAVVVGRGDLGRDGARHGRADLGDDLLEIAAGFGDERGVGGYAVEQARSPPTP